MTNSVHSSSSVSGPIITDWKSSLPPSSRHEFITPVYEDLYGLHWGPGLCNSIVETDLPWSLSHPQGVGTHYIARASFLRKPHILDQGAACHEPFYYPILQFPQNHQQSDFEAEKWLDLCMYKGQLKLLKWST